MSINLISVGKVGQVFLQFFFSLHSIYLLIEFIDFKL